MEIINYIKQIEQYLCNHFDEWDLDDPVEEEYFSEYNEIAGVSQEEIITFEKKYNIDLPDDFKELYQYKNGSRFFCVLPTVIGKSDMTFCLMSLKEMDDTKNYFQNKDALLLDFPDYFTAEDIKRIKDKRIKPYLFNKKWFPFAQYCNSCYLMMDFDPTADGQKGQIICYIHDPDKVVYVAPSIFDLVSKITKEI
ncbi:SMI1/KNR4 family protein [Campylobacter sp. MOP51]|uniref:SMI1/KNR4 family protein n=1 Tax=Campylobacter canis TaxID=3378588 RepID=UPI003C3F027C